MAVRLVHPLSRYVSLLGLRPAQTISCSPILLGFTVDFLVVLAFRLFATSTVFALAIG